MPYRFQAMSSRGEATREAILDSARIELAKSGILGLRVAEVAAGAQTSVTAIYRYFGDRDGLLAEVLTEVYTDLTTATVDEYEKRLGSDDGLTVRDLVNALPVPFDMQHPIQKFRIQVLAAAAENEQLARNLQAVMKDRLERWQETLGRIGSRMAPGEQFDERVFWSVLFDYMPYSSGFLDDEKFSVASFREFLVDKLRANT